VCLAFEELCVVGSRLIQKQKRDFSPELGIIVVIQVIFRGADPYPANTMGASMNAVYESSRFSRVIAPTSGATKLNDVSSRVLTATMGTF